jgi:hypothetical protein
LKVYIKDMMVMKEIVHEVKKGDEMHVIACRTIAGYPNLASENNVIILEPASHRNERSRGETRPH